jgi:hypothetical protein
MGRTSEHARLFISTSLSRRKFQALLRKAPSHNITLNNLSVLGESERLIIRNLSRLIEKSASLRIASPRLTLKKQTAMLLKAIRESERENTSRRRTVSRLVSSILKGTSFAKPALGTQELIQKVSALRAEGKSLRSISASAEVGVSKTTVSRILKMNSVLRNSIK